MSEHIVDLTQVETAEGLGDLDTYAWLTALPVREQIVRCKDCEHYKEHKWILITDVSDVCEFFSDGVKVEPNGFCKWGVRKEPSE